MREKERGGGKEREKQVEGELANCFIIFFFFKYPELDPELLPLYCIARMSVLILFLNTLHYEDSCKTTKDILLTLVATL